MRETTSWEAWRVWPAQWLRPEPVPSWFPEPRPLEVDVGCGKGRYLLARAAARPDRNLLGIDRMLRRIRKVCRKACLAGLANVRLLRLDAAYAVSYLLPPASVDRYTVFFPDPWPKARHHAHRLFDERFNAALLRTLTPGGTLYLATDHRPYFEEIVALLGQERGFRRIDPYLPSEEEVTEFERRHAPHGPIHRAGYRRVG